MLFPIYTNDHMHAKIKKGGACVLRYISHRKTPSQD